MTSYQLTIWILTTLLISVFGNYWNKLFQNFFLIINALLLPDLHKKFKNFVDTSVQKIKIVMEQDAIEKVKKNLSVGYFKC